MITSDEMIAVIQAHKEGKKIEWRLKGIENAEWYEYKNEDYNFQMCEYRIKPEPHYRPFKSAKEAMGAIKEHKDWLKTSTDDSQYSNIIRICSNGLWKLSYDNSEIEYVSFETAFYNFCFEDETPFGVKIEE